MATEIPRSHWRRRPRALMEDGVAIACRECNEITELATFFVDRYGGLAEFRCGHCNWHVLRPTLEGWKV